MIRSAIIIIIMIMCLAGCTMAPAYKRPDATRAFLVAEQAPLTKRPAAIRPVQLPPKWTGESSTQTKRCRRSSAWPLITTGT